MFGSSNSVFFPSFRTLLPLLFLVLSVFFFLPCDDGDGIRWAVALLRRSCSDVYWELISSHNSHSNFTLDCKSFFLQKTSVVQSAVYDHVFDHLSVRFSDGGRKTNELTSTERGAELLVANTVLLYWMRWIAADIRHHTSHCTDPLSLDLMVLVINKHCTFPHETSGGGYGNNNYDYLIT
jgi:hypothetical protein